MTRIPAPGSTLKLMILSAVLARPTDLADFQDVYQLIADLLNAQVKMGVAHRSYPEEGAVIERVRMDHVNDGLPLFAQPFALLEKSDCLRDLGVQHKGM